MSREITNVLSTGLDIYNCVICLFMIFSLIRKSKYNLKRIYFILVCICVLIFNIGDMSNWIAEGTNPYWHIPFLHIGTFSYYFITPFALLFLIKYMLEYLKPHKVKNIYFKVSLVICFVYIVLVCITPFTGFFYYISADNYYHRGPYQYVAFVFYTIFYLLTAWICLANWKLFTRKTLISFLSYAFLPTIMELIQLRFYGLSLVNTGMTFSLLIIFMNSHWDLEKSYKATSVEAHENQRKLINFQEHTILSLSNLVENRDIETGEHAQRTSIFVQILAHQTKKDGYYSDILTDDYIKLMVRAAPMHDIGKIKVSDTILKKPGRLTTEEYEQMKIHAAEGGRIVNDIIGISDDKQYVQIAIDMAQSHHERWDGTGYPERLKAEEIPLCARFMAIADVFDALVFERCYKKPIPTAEAFKIMEAEAGTHFDPTLIEEFLKLKDEIRVIIPENDTVV